MPTKRQIRTEKAKTLTFKGIEFPMASEEQLKWDEVLPPEPKILRFKHANAISHGGPIKVMAVPYPGMAANTFQCSSMGSNFYWQSDDGKAPKVQVGQVLDQIRVDGVYVFVREVAPAPVKAVKTSLDNVSIPVAKLREYAGKSPEFKAVLHTVCPDAFVTDDIAPVWGDVKSVSTLKSEKGITMLERREGGLYTGFVWLNPDFEWRIVNDGAALVLVPREKL